MDGLLCSALKSRASVPMERVKLISIRPQVVSVSEVAGEEVANSPPTSL
jgi:hypothetical protein